MTSEALPNTSQTGDAEVIDMQAEHDKRFLEAQAGIAELDLSYLDSPGFDMKRTPIPLPFIDGVLTYFLHPEINLSDRKNWPPQTWRNNYKITDLFAFPKIDYPIKFDDDPIAIALERDIVRIAKLLPTRTEVAPSWQKLLKICRRLRIDELEQTSEETTSFEQQSTRSALWDALIVKLADQKPDELRKP